MASAALQSFRQTVTVDWPAQQQAKAKAALIRVAEEGNRRTLSDQTSRSGGITPDVTAYANHPGNTDLQSVVLPGPIVYRYGYLREVIAAAQQMLREGSPVHSGKYRDSHTIIYLNGVATKAPPDRLSETDEIIISNPLPYARKIEVGVTKSGRKFTIEVENHLYERTRQALLAKYRNVARIDFDFVQLPNAYELRSGPIRRNRRAGSKARGSALTYPALIITAPK